MKIKPNLFLNMSPQTTEDGALAYARNMKLDDDGNLISDYGYKNITCNVSNDANPAVSLSTYDIVGHIVGLDNKIYFFCSTLNETSWENSKIIEYDELNDTAAKIDSNWTYSGGEIDGYVSTNQSGDKILTIGEFKESGEIPLKHINLSFPDVEESFYSQAPVCPTANLTIKDTYMKTIPNGVYVFFIRYKLRKDVYTDWFLCSRPIFSGSSEEFETIQGGIKHVNLHKDSAKSFVLKLDFASVANKSSYKEFQLGFIITHDEATDARIWKSFKLSSFIDDASSIDNSNLIYFDYENIEEANIDDLLKVTYELYNVRNITSFKNKLYISNYKETNFNPNLAPEAETNPTPAKISLQVNRINNRTVSKSATYNEKDLIYNDTKRYYDKINDGLSEVTVKQYISNRNNDIDFSLTNLFKESSTTKDNVAEFKMMWDANFDPDICVIYSLTNNLYNKSLFGNDFTLPIPNDNDPSATNSVTKVGIYLLGTSGTYTTYYYYDPSGNHGYTNHPWFDKLFTFVYGSARSIGTSVSIYKDGSYKFNKYSLAYGGQTYGVSNVWITQNESINEVTRDSIEDNVKKELKDRGFFVECYIEITSGTKTYYIGKDDAMTDDNYFGYNLLPSLYGISPSDDINFPNESWKFFVDNVSGNANGVTVLNPKYCNTNTLDENFSTYIENLALTTIKDKIDGIDESGNIVLLIDGTPVHANSIAVKFKKFDFEVDFDNVESTENRFIKSVSVSLDTTNYAVLCTFKLIDGILVVDNADSVTQTSTIMPFSIYKPYVHFVDNHNIITNGFPLPNNIDTTRNGNSDWTLSTVPTDADVMFLDYKVENANNTKYKSFFISLVNIGDLVIECFNIQQYGFNNRTKIAHCLEIDALLYNINDNIKVKLFYKTVNDNTEYYKEVTAIYCSSSTSNPSTAFGNCGYITWNDVIRYTEVKAYVIISRNKSTENITNLTKASSYIPLTNTYGFVRVPDGNYGSWICVIKKPSFDLSSNCYVSGNDIYTADRSTVLKLSEFKGYISVQTSSINIIRSSFNLNYLSTSEDINDKIFNIGSTSSGVKQVAKVINSAILSNIYELKPMYKDYANKYFRPIETDYRITFDNTIRVSNVLSDETFNNSIFKFSAEDYYNVPTDRGIIVNMFSIGNNIFVHCKSSLYKFDGNQTIMSNNEDIKLQESEPFDGGITNVIDSEYGYGGIDNKQSGCITFDSYFFYDKSSNHIFAYGGNSQIQIIDGNIYKLLTYYKPSECKALHDEYNCRVLFEFTSGRSEHSSATYKTFTLSYNYKSKTFVSFHDLSLINSFASANKVYSYKNKNNLLNLFVTDNILNEQTGRVIDTRVLVAGMNVNNIFGDATTACIIEFGSQIYKKQTTPFGIAVVILPKENIKETVDSVKYIGDIVKKDAQTQVSPIYDVLVNPQVTRTNPVINFYIVTDSCVSSIVNTDVDDTARPNSLLDYKGFKYDMGFWTSNYFRNNINNTNVYQYLQKYPNRTLDIDNNSLVYGRYFIFVMEFKHDIPVKIEELFMNSVKY